MKVKTTEGRHGTFMYFADDTFVGKSLEMYGEYSESEVAAYQTCLKEGDVAIVVGANIGALVVPMARIVGPTGRIFAYEPQPATCQLLRQNLVLNNIENVTVKQCAVGADHKPVFMPRLEAMASHNYGAASIGTGELVVQVETLDDIPFDRVDFIQIDAEGSELQVLKGASGTLAKFRPMLYVENDRQEKATELIGFLVDFGYRCFWHRPYLYNAMNYRREKRNAFGNIVSINMLCVPSEKRDAQGYFEVHGLDEVADLRITPDMYEREYKRFALETERHPKDLTPRLLMAHYAGCMQRTDEARELLAENLKIEPQHPASKMILGLLDLQAGRYAMGWNGYELRHIMKDKAHFGGGRTFDCPKWDGSETDEPVLIWAEQGFGDNIMFARFMREVLRRVPNAVLEVPPQLFELFELSNICPRLYRQHRTLPSHKFHCSLPSLPAVLKLYDEQQLRSTPYIFAEPHMQKIWHERLGPDFRVGVCYKGSPKSERPWSRDIAPERLEPVLRRYEPNVIDLTQTGQFESFCDTAACIQALDLVITVDTSVAHLAGAMGKETWLLLSTDPDWRWGLREDTTIWYDSVRILRQHKFMDWSGVMRKLEEKLDGSEAIRATA